MWDFLFGQKVVTITTVRTRTITTTKPKKD